MYRSRPRRARRISGRSPPPSPRGEGIRRPRDGTSNFVAEFRNCAAEFTHSAVELRSSTAERANSADQFANCVAELRKCAAELRSSAVQLTLTLSPGRGDVFTEFTRCDQLHSRRPSPSRCQQSRRGEQGQRTRAGHRLKIVCENVVSNIITKRVGVLRVPVKVHAQIHTAERVFPGHL